jgi:nucleoside-diphosphate-sugar epimerase
MRCYLQIDTIIPGLLTFRIPTLQGTINVIEACRRHGVIHHHLPSQFSSFAQNRASSRTSLKRQQIRAKGNRHVHMC